METREIVVDETKYQFVNEGWSTSRSWGHRSVLLRNGFEIGEKKIRYYNRTWESYRFQSCMQCCVDDILQDKYESEKKYFKQRHGLSRLAGKMKDQFENEFLNNEQVRELKKVQEALCTA